MISRAGIGALFAIIASTQLCLAADPRYPDWPCAQAKVPEISLAAVWAGPPLGDAEEKWKNDPKVSALVEKVAARKTPLEDAQKATAGKLVFAGLFEQLNAERSSVMSGLERVTRKQRQAADKVRTDTVALQALQDATSPDQSKIGELSNTLIWETRIFEDRRRVVKFVCEVPTTIDQRLFAFGRTIQQEIE